MANLVMPAVHYFEPVLPEKDHPQYDQAYAAILAAFAGGKKVQVYIHSCEPVTWYANTSTTFNIVTASGAYPLKSK